MWASSASTPTAQILLEREYRHGVGEVLWQIPGGLMDPAEDRQAAGLRELREETGFAPAQVNDETVRYLGCVWDNPAFGPMRSYLYAAWGLAPTATTKRDPEEFVTLHWVSPDWLKEAVRSGRNQRPGRRRRCRLSALERLVVEFRIGGLRSDRRFSHLSATTNRWLQPLPCFLRTFHEQCPIPNPQSPILRPKGHRPGRGAGLRVAVGQVVDVRPDVVLSHDNTAAIRRIWQEFGQDRVVIPERMAITLDHAVPAPTTKHAQNHAEIRAFVQEQGIRHFFEVGRGICHQVLSEEAVILPGQMILGADSHTPHFGWMGAFGAGIGRSEVAALWATGELWLRVPESMRIVLEGDLPAGVTAKDFALRIIGDLGADGGLYASVEFSGSGITRHEPVLPHGPPQHDGRVWGQERLYCAG